jgi:hypothetical protein
LKKRTQKKQYMVFKPYLVLISMVVEGTEKMNTRLPCIVRWVGVYMDILVKWLNWPHTSFKALRAGRTSNVQHRILNGGPLSYQTKKTSVFATARTRQDGAASMRKVE